jgi:hypothetical protein
LDNGPARPPDRGGLHLAGRAARPGP